VGLGDTSSMVWIAPFAGRRRIKLPSKKLSIQRSWVFGDQASPDASRVRRYACCAPVRGSIRVTPCGFGWSPPAISEIQRWPPP
jgi:hypothetical protein